MITLLIHFHQSHYCTFKAYYTESVLVSLRVENLRRVDSKPRLLYQLAQAALGHPDQTVRAGIYPVVNEAQLRAIVREYQAGTAYHQQAIQPEGWRALTPLIYHHITPHGWFRLNLQERLPIEEVRSA